MKRFLKKLFIFMFCIGFFAELLCFVIDPLNVFHSLNARNTGVDPNLRYVKMTYILNNPEKYDAFIFGSCRASTIYANRLGGADEQYRFYNMTVQAGEPINHLHNIQTLLNNGVGIKKIYLGFDSPYESDTNDLNHILDVESYEFSQAFPVKFWLRYLDPAIVGNSLPFLINYLRKVPSKTDVERIYTNGNYWSWDGETSFHGSNMTYESTSEPHIDEALDVMREIVSLCEENEIEYVIFAMPLHKVAYTALQKRHEEFLRGLASITPFYNFSGINELTTDDQYWFSEEHFRSEVGNLMVDAMCNGKCPDNLYAQGFGWYVTKDNIDELFALPEMNGSALLDK